MAFFRAFNCRILYGLNLPTVILTVIWYSITHSLLLPSLQIFPTVALPFFLLKYLLHGFPGLFTVISGHICFLLFVFSSVFTLFSCRFRAVD